MSRVTPAGHHISGAAEPDLAYIAERAAAAARRSDEQLERLVDHARAAEDRFGAGSPATSVSWRGVIIQAAQTATLRDVADDRRRLAGLPADGSLAGSTIVELSGRVYAIDGIGIVAGRAAAALLPVLLGRAEPLTVALIAVYLELARPGDAFYVADGDPLPVAPPDQPTGPGRSYRVRRTK
jgi:hypothetical protein